MTEYRELVHFGAVSELIFTVLCKCKHDLLMIEKLDIRQERRKLFLGL